MVKKLNHTKKQVAIIKIPLMENMLQRFLHLKKNIR